MQLWFYQIENLGFLLLEFGKQHLLVSCLGFAVALMICRVWRYQRSCAEPFVWAILFLWLALSPLWLALLWVIQANMELSRQSLLGQPCAVPIYNRLSSSLPWIPQLSWNMIAIAIWFLCALAMGSSWLRKRRRFRRVLRSATVTSDARVLHSVKQWRLRLGIRRPVRLLISASVTQAFTVGVVRPVILLPESLLDTLNDQQLTAILGHELAHIKRFDDLWVMLEAMIRAVLWFNPLMRRGASALRQIRECESDRLAVRHGDLDPREYAQTLLALSTPGPFRPAAPELGFGAHGGELPQRIAALVNHSSPLNLRAILTTTAFLTGIAIVLSFGASSNAMLSFTEFDRQLLQDFNPGPPISGAVITRDFHADHHDSCQISSASPHPGVDLGATRDPTVRNIQDGVIEDVSAGRGGYEGHNVRIRHRNGLSSIYAHLQDISVEPGDAVPKGTAIGRLRSGHYLHFEIHYRNRSLDISSLTANLSEPRSSASG